MGTKTNLIGKKFGIGNCPYGRFGATTVTVIAQDEISITVDAQITESGNSSGLNRFFNQIELGNLVEVSNDVIVNVIEIEGEIETIDFPSDLDEKFYKAFLVEANEIYKTESLKILEASNEVETTEGEKAADLFYTQETVKIKNKIFPIFKRLASGESKLVDNSYMANKAKYKIVYPNQDYVKVDRKVIIQEPFQSISSTKTRH